MPPLRFDAVLAQVATPRRPRLVQAMSKWWRNFLYGAIGFAVVMIVMLKWAFTAAEWITAGHSTAGGLLLGVPILIMFSVVVGLTVAEMEDLPP